MALEDKPGSSYQSGDDKQSHKHVIGIGSFHERTYCHGTANKTAYAKHMCADLPHEGDENGNHHDRHRGCHDHHEPPGHVHPVIIDDHGRVRQQRDQIGIKPLPAYFQRQVRDNTHTVEHEYENGGNNKREKKYRRDYLPELMPVYYSEIGIYKEEHYPVGRHQQRLKDGGNYMRDRLHPDGYFNKRAKLYFFSQT